MAEPTMEKEGAQEAPELEKLAARVAGTGAPDEDPDALDPELAVPRGDEVTAVLEALLFASTTPLNAKRLSVLMNGVPEEEITAAVGDLMQRYEHERCGLMVMEVAGGWQAATKSSVADWVLRLHRHRKKNPLTPAIMETLAIIAYKQPITRADVEAVRGVDCGNPLRALQDAGLVEVVGRKEVIGRPPLYGTTELFLKTFGLRDIDGLPSLGELRAILESATAMQAPEPAPAAEEAPAPPADAESGDGQPAGQ